MCWSPRLRRAAWSPGQRLMSTDATSYHAELSQRGDEAVRTLAVELDQTPAGGDEAGVGSVAVGRPVVRQQRCKLLLDVHAASSTLIREVRFQET